MPKPQKSEGFTLYSLVPLGLKADVAREEMVRRGFDMGQPYKIKPYRGMVLMLQRKETTDGGHETPLHEGQGGE